MKKLYFALLSFVFLTGCQGDSPAPSAVIESPTAEVVVAEPTATPSYQFIEPLPVLDAVPPVLIEIPAVGLLHPVMPMEWEVAEVEGQRTTVWKVPDNAAGWHINSVGVGAKGNIILSGHQEQDSAVFKSIALGSVQVGQEIFLTDEEGSSYVYRVIEVSEPIPLDGTTSEQFATIEQYYAQGTQPRLTLITGWPDFSTTHRLFVVAEFVGLRG